jgi:hypothetical protein
LAVGDEQVRVEVPVPPAMVVVVRLQVRPAGVDAETESITVSVNPLTDDIVIVDAAAAPGLIDGGETGPAAIWKSATLTLI